VDVLVLLLMDGEFVLAETVERLLPAGAAEKLEALSLIARDPERQEAWFGGCILFAGSVATNVGKGMEEATKKAVGSGRFPEFFICSMQLP